MKMHRILLNMSTHAGKGMVLCVHNDSQKVQKLYTFTNGKSE